MKAVLLNSLKRLLKKFFRFYKPNFIKIGLLVQELQHFFFGKIAIFLQIFSKSDFFGFYGDMYVPHSIYLQVSESRGFELTPFFLQIWQLQDGVRCSLLMCS